MNMLRYWLIFGAVATAYGEQFEFSSSPARGINFQVDRLVLRCSLTHTASLDNENGTPQSTRKKVSYVNYISVTSDGAPVARLSATPFRFENSFPVGSNFRLAGWVSGPGQPLERCYLEMTWINPNQSRVGSYLCEINATDEFNQTIIFKKSIEVRNAPLSLDQVSDYILTNRTSFEEPRDIWMQALKALEFTRRNLIRKDWALQRINSSLIQRERAFQTMNSSLIKTERALQTMNSSLIQRERELQTMNSSLILKKRALQTMNSSLIQRERALQTMNSSLIQTQRTLQTMNSDLTQTQRRLQSMHTETGLSWCGGSKSWPSGRKLKTIKFRRPYDVVPKVTVGLSGIDVSNAYNARIMIKVLKVNTTEFTFECITWADTIIYEASIDWIVTN